MFVGVGSRATCEVREGCSLYNMFMWVGSRTTCVARRGLRTDGRKSRVANDDQTQELLS